MKNLKQNESGIAHMLLIVIFVIVFVGLAAFAYTRISSDDSSNSETNALEEPIEEDDEQLSSEADDPVDPSEDLEAIEAQAASEESAQ